MPPISSRGCLAASLKLHYPPSPIPKLNHLGSRINPPPRNQLNSSSHSHPCQVLKVSESPAIFDSPASLLLNCPRFTLQKLRPLLPETRARDYIASARQRRSYSSDQNNHKRQHRAAIGSWFTVLAVGFAGGAYILHSYLTYSTTSTTEKAAGESEEAPYPETSSEEIENWHSMTGETQPGRPGTLTPEQEEKLREFWVALLQIYGVYKEPNGKPATAPSIQSETAPDKKKNRRSLFGRKHKEEETSELSATDDDKYGQAKQFQVALASLSPDELRDTLWGMVKHDHPDALLLRFLRARKWDVEKALIMMVSTMHWRATEMHVDEDIMKNGELGALEASQNASGETKATAEGFLAQMRMGKSFLHGYDAEGRPLCFVRARLHKQGEQNEQSLERYTVFLIESARMILSPPVDTACIIFDMTGFSLANMDYTPVKFMIKCFEANYPESLGVVLVHKAPWVFQGIWRIIKGWLDPVVASKVKFTNNETEMEHYIPRDHIPKDLGGTEDWEYKYIDPIPGEDDLMKDTATRDSILAERAQLYKAFEEETVKWIGSGSSPDVGNIKTKRHQLAIELRDSYWKLDPYVRAKSFYDRTGLIKPDGKLEFYPGVVREPTASVDVPFSNGFAKAETAADDVD